MKTFLKIGFTLFFYILTVFFSLKSVAQTKPAAFKVLAIAENGGHHIAYSKGAKIWLDKLAKEKNFSIDYIQNTEKINEEYLSHYQLFIQLDFPPYAWTPTAAAAFEKYINEGKGGWIGFHHATLLGEFDGYPMWNWFHDFMGGIRFKNYISTFASGKVNVEDKKHPVMKGVPASFVVKTEEWYTYDKSPRPNVHVIASVDESTYIPDSTKVKMGDHPVVWTNPKIAAKNVYIFMGHSPDLFENKAYTTLFQNAIFWAAKK
ncbi:ThuA domain-containing protein [Dyadobacter subterraneus]|uniref:ThuA domain-containing protein n=1 Tax=Dyadobacter subterraneus TaxID=2773304 RepID=A0ABR9WG72_9BACT|nr:ThuA domain-containing protein [Dyadobacter subterraneus]MBE9464388.1 ThuA domain-containing protein [Dyadobacter subterraneus]